MLISTKDRQTTRKVTTKHNIIFANNMNNKSNDPILNEDDLTYISCLRRSGGEGVKKRRLFSYENREIEKRSRLPLRHLSTACLISKSVNLTSPSTAHSPFPNQQRQCATHTIDAAGLQHRDQRIQHTVFLISVPE